MPSLSPITRTVTSMPFDENTYIVYLDGQTDCVIVDPGLEPGQPLGQPVDPLAGGFIWDRGQPRRPRARHRRGGRGRHNRRGVPS